jgi:hypothetical protein
MLAASLAPLPARAAPQPRATVTIRTLPALEGVRFRLDGTTAATDGDGVARVRVPLGSHRLGVGVPRKLGAVARIDAVRGDDGTSSPRRPLSVTSDVEIRVGLALSHLVRIRFEDGGGEVVDPASIDSVVLAGGADTATVPGHSAGVRGPTAPRWQRHPAGTQWLRSTRVSAGPETGVEEISYAVRAVRVGDMTLSASAPSFSPEGGDAVTVTVDARAVAVGAVDALLRSSLDDDVEVALEDGSSVIAAPGEQVLVPEGSHEARAGSGLAVPATFSVPGDAEVSAPVVTAADAGIAVLLLLAVAAAAALARRRAAGRSLRPEAADERPGRHVRVRTRDGRTIEGWTTASDEDQVLVVTVERVFDEAGVEQPSSPADSFLARRRVVSVDDMAVAPSPMAPRRDALPTRGDLGEPEGDSATAL